MARRNRSQSTDFDVDTDMGWDAGADVGMDDTSTTRRGRKGGRTQQGQGREDTGMGTGEEGIGGTPSSGTTIDDDF